MNAQREQQTVPVTPLVATLWAPILVTAIVATEKILDQICVMVNLNHSLVLHIIIIMMHILCV